LISVELWNYKFGGVPQTLIAMKVCLNRLLQWFTMTFSWRHLIAAKFFQVDRVCASLVSSMTITENAKCLNVHAEVLQLCVRRDELWLSSAVALWHHSTSGIPGAPRGDSDEDCGGVLNFLLQCQKEVELAKSNNSEKDAFYGFNGRASFYALWWVLARDANHGTIFNPGISGLSFLNPGIRD